MKMKPASVGLLPTCALAVGVLLAGFGCQSVGPTRATDSAIFDEHADGEALVRAALARASVEHKSVFLFFGANWCAYCWKLHELMESDPAIRQIVADALVVVPLDVGTSGHNRNTDLIDRYGATVFTHGTPAVVIVDAEGRRLAPSRDNPWPARDWIAPGRLLAFLERALR